MNADERLDWISKYFKLDDGMPSYDELLAMLDAVDEDLSIALHRLKSVEEERNILLAQRDAAYDALNYIEDLEEDIMASIAYAQADRTLLINLFNRVRTV